MTQKKLQLDPKRYNPTFQWSFLAPKYWPTWLAIALGILLSFLPHGIKLSFAGLIAKKITKKKRGTIHNAWVNLSLCFPEKTQQQREQLLLESVTTAVCFLLGFAALTVRSAAWLQRQTTLTGMAHIEQALANNDNIMLLVPHTWCIDIPAILLASKGLPVTGFMSPQRNKLGDWLMHRQRVQYGGQLFERSAGIKTFIKSIRQGYMGYYLGDQDQGRDSSLFINFFHTPKATLSSASKIAQLGKAKIIPLFASYDMQSGQYRIDIDAAWQPGSEQAIAEKMNQFIEHHVTQRPEQYMWNLRLFKTQADEHSTYNPYNDPAYKEAEEK